MFELPGRLRVIERRRVARELELLHHLLRAAVFAFEKQRQINFKFDDLRDLILVAARRRCGAKERFEPITRLGVILFLEWNLREVVLRFPELRIDFRRLFEGGFRAVEIFLRQQNFAAQIDGRRLIWIGGVGFIHKFAGGGQIALLEGLLGLLKLLRGERLPFCLPVGGRGQLEGRAGLPRGLLEPAHFVERFGKQFVELRREILLRFRQPILRFLLVLMLERQRGIRVMDRRRVGRKLELGQHRIDHVLLSLEEIRQQNFVLDELRRVAFEFSGVALKQGLETFPRFGPVLPQKRNLRQVEARIPKFRIGRERFLQRYFRLIVAGLAHQNNAAEILRFRQIGLPGIDRVELL